MAKCWCDAIHFCVTSHASYSLLFGHRPWSNRIKISHSKHGNERHNCKSSLCLVFFLSISNWPALNSISYTFLQHCPVQKGCNFENLSCRYLSHLNSTIIKEYYPDPEAAVEAVRIGHAWGAVYFTENFTDALVARMALGMWILLSLLMELNCRFSSLLIKWVHNFDKQDEMRMMKH